MTFSVAVDNISVDNIRQSSSASPIANASQTMM